MKNNHKSIKIERVILIKKTFGTIQKYPVPSNSWGTAIYSTENCCVSVLS